MLNWVGMGADVLLSSTTGLSPASDSSSVDRKEFVRQALRVNCAGSSAAACDEQRDAAGSPTSHERGVVEGEDTPEDEPSDWPVGVHLAAAGDDPQPLGERERAIRADTHQRLRVGADLVGF